MLICLLWLFRTSCQTCYRDPAPELLWAILPYRLWESLRWSSITVEPLKLCTFTRLKLVCSLLSSCPLFQCELSYCLEIEWLSLILSEQAPLSCHLCPLFCQFWIFLKFLWPSLPCFHGCWQLGRGRNLRRVCLLGKCLCLFIDLLLPWKRHP